MIDDAKPDDMPEDGELFRRLKQWFKADREHLAEWRRDAAEDFAFAAGDQYTDEERAYLKQQLRPMITFNRVDPVIRAVSGAEVTSRQEVRYIPREPGDAAPNETLTAAAQWFRDQSDADDEDSDAFVDAAICGIGWTETRLDYEEDPEGAPRIDRIDPLEMLWDRHARKRNLADARRVWRVKMMPRDEAEALFEDADAASIGAKWAELDTDDDEAGDGDKPFYDGDGSDGDTPRRADERVAVVECQWWDREKVFTVTDPETGRVVQLTPEKYEAVLAASAASGMPIKGVRSTRRRFRRAFLGADKILWEGPTPCGSHFSFQAITGFRDRNKGSFYGLVRAMKDPQRWANKWLSQVMHIMNTSAKGGIMAEEGVAADEKEFEESWSRADSITRVKSGVLQAGRIQPKPQVAFPAGFYQLMEFAIGSVRDVTGVNLEILGMREANQPASLEYQRRQAGMTILATLFDSLKRYRKLQGRVLLHLITEYLSDGRLIRIVGGAAEQYVPLLKQNTDVRYDVIVDDAPSTPNQKEFVWSFIGPMFMTLPPNVQAVLIDYAPLPETVIAKLREAIEQGMNDPNNQAAQQIAQAKMAAEAKKLESESVENIANAEHNLAQARALGFETEMKQLLARYGIQAGPALPNEMGGMPPPFAGPVR